MKGIVFTEFLDFVSAHHGEDMVDDIIESSDLSSGGAYTSVGTYDHVEMVALCQALAARIKEPVEEIIKQFGIHLSDTFAKAYTAFFSRCNHFFDFLESIEAHIHKEVHKLYPDAELPTFKVKERSDSALVMDYQSPRHFGALAEGLIVGTAKQFGVKVQVRPEVLTDTIGQSIRFYVELI